MKKKVLHFIHGLNTGGAESLVVKYAILIDKDKYDVTVLCYQHYLDSPFESLLSERGVRVIYACDNLIYHNKHNLFSKIVNHYDLYIQLRRIIRKIDPDIIHTHLPHNYLLRYVKPDNQVKIIYTHHFSVQRWRKHYHGDITNLKWLIKHYDTYLIALHEDMQRELMEMFHTDRVFRLNNGIDLEAYRKTIDASSKRRSLGIPEDAFVIVHVGRFNAVKNHEYLVQVFAEIKKRRQDAFLLMVGSGTEEERIRQKLEELDLSGAYTILHNRTDVPELLLASNAAVFPSVIEGLGIAVIEIQAAGLPCVASTGVPQSAAISNKIRFLSLDESPKVWAEELLSLCTDTTPIRYDGIDEWDIADTSLSRFCCRSITA